MVINDGQLKIGKMQTRLSAASCQMCCLSKEAGTDGVWKNFGLQATKSQRRKSTHPHPDQPLCLWARRRQSVTVTSAAAKWVFYWQAKRVWLTSVAVVSFNVCLKRDKNPYFSANRGMKLNSWQKPWKHNSRSWIPIIEVLEWIQILFVHKI